MKELLNPDNFVWGNIIWNGAWFAAAIGLFLKRFSTLEKKLSEYCTINREDHKDIHGRITGHETRISKIEARAE